MKKLIIVSCMTLVFSSISLSHDPYTHQLIVREAYKLLKAQRGPIPVMDTHLGFEETGSGPWKTGLMVTGAWREDEEDVVYGYSKSKPPSLNVGLAYLAPSTVIELLYIGVVGIPGVDPFVSSTHFWDADNGDFQGSNGATSYTLQWSTNLSLTDADSAAVSSASYALSGLSRSTTYYWRVRAENVGGTSGWSVVRSFTTVPPPPLVPVPIAPCEQ